MKRSGSDQQVDKGNKNRQYWEDIKSQLQELAELKKETDQFECPCQSNKDCPFRVNDNPTLSHSATHPSFSHSVSCPNMHRRGSSPSTFQIRKNICYGGFESVFMKNSNEANFDIDDEEPEVYSKHHQMFTRGNRSAPVRRKKNVLSSRPLSMPMGTSVTLPNDFRTRTCMQPNITEVN